MWNSAFQDDDEKAEKSDDDKQKSDDEESEKKSDDIHFIVITRSTATNPKDVKTQPFVVVVGKTDPMLNIREKIVIYCHSTHDIETDKMVDAKLKIVDVNKRTMLFTNEHDSTAVKKYLCEHGLKAPYKIIMPLNFEGVGGGT